MPIFDLAKISLSVQALGRRNESALLIAARTITHSEAARRLATPKQTMQDWRDSEHKEACLIYAAYGLKLVPYDDQNYSEADIAALQHLAHKGILSMRPLPKQGAVVQEEIPEPGTDELT